MACHCWVEFTLHLRAFFLQEFLVASHTAFVLGWSSAWAGNGWKRIACSSSRTWARRTLMRSFGDPWSGRLLLDSSRKKPLKARLASCKSLWKLTCCFHLAVACNRLFRTDMFRGAYADIWRDGVFAKDPDLKDFLISGPAVLAALQMQHAFEMKFSHKDRARVLCCHCCVICRMKDCRSVTCC